MKIYAATDRTFVTLDSDRNILFLQLRTGRLTGANAQVAEVWQEFEQCPGIDLDRAIVAAAERIGMDPATLRSQMRGPVSVLLKDGILTTRPPAVPPRRIVAILAGETAQPERREPANPRETVPGRVAIASAMGLSIMLILKRLPFWVQLEILMAIRRALPQHATVAQTRQLAAAVNRAARWCPGRTECLEQSIAAFIGGALLGAPPYWCHGGSLLNDLYHAWVQAEDTAIDYTDQYGGSITTMIRLLLIASVGTGPRSVTEPFPPGGRCCATTFAGAKLVALHGPPRDGGDPARTAASTGTLAGEQQRKAQPDVRTTVKPRRSVGRQPRPASGRWRHAGRRRHCIPDRGRPVLHARPLGVGG
jgi:hypothetical protein